MADLIVRNVDEAIVEVLRMRAAKHGVSVETEHRRILEQVLLQPRRKSFVEVLRLIPNVGNDLDFARGQDDSIRHVGD